MPKQLPTFNSEQEEQDFWANADSADYVDWSQVRWVVLPHRKPSTQTISLRLPEHLVDSLKLLANKRDVPYQSLLKLFLAEQVEAELRDVYGKKPSKTAERCAG